MHLRRAQHRPPRSLARPAVVLLRGLWWRRWASLVLVLCTVVTVAGAAAGPLWGRAAQASLLARTTQDARVSELAWTVSGSTSAYSGLTVEAPEPATVVDDVRTAAALPPDLDARFDRATEVLSTPRRLQVSPVRTLLDGTVVPDPEVLAPLGRLVAREGACERLDLVAGACPAATTDLLLSDRSAALLAVTAGDRVQVPELGQEAVAAGDPDDPPGLVRVAGVYAVESVEVDDRFWFDSEDLEFAPPTSAGGDPVPARLDAVLVTPDLLLSLQVLGVQVRQERVLRPGAVGLEDADRVAARLDGQVEQVASSTRTVEAAAPAATTLRSTAPGRALVADTATFVGLQVVVLGWVVLLGLVATSIASRDTEMAQAKLRGLRGRRLALHVLAEPVVLVVVAVPVGVLTSWVGVRLIADRVLLPGTPVVAPPLLWWVLAATTAGALLACVLSARRSWRVPVAEQLRRETPPPGTAGPVVLAVVSTLAGVGLALVLTLGRGAQVALPALLTPVLVGLAAGLLTGALVQAVVRTAAGRTHRWRLAPYLAVRQLAGRRATTWTTALVTAATAVSGFAAGAYVVTAGQREAQARIDVGADRVVHVAPGPVDRLLAATQEVDPTGRWAMAAVQRGTGDEGTVLAVDATRFGVASGVPGGDLARPGALDELVPADVPEPLVVRGGTATVVVAGSAFQVNEQPEGAAPVRLGVQLRVLTDDGDVRSTVLGVLDGGPQTLTAAVPDCRTGCTVAGVRFLRVEGTGPVAGAVTLLSLEVGATTAPFVDGEWRSVRIDESVPDSTPAGSLRPVGGVDDGLAVQFTAGPSVTPGVVRRDIPTELPAVIGARTDLDLIGTRDLVEGSTLEGESLPLSVAGTTPVLPRAPAGTVVDLELVARADPPRSVTLDHQVWLSPAAPADAVDRLAAAGLRVVELETRADRRAELDAAEPARAQLLLIAAGLAVLLAGVAGVATALAGAARRRAAEGAALRAMAAPPATVRLSAVLEEAMVLVPGALVGAGCAAWLVAALSPVLAQVTGAADVVAGRPATADVVLPALAAGLLTVLLLVPVVAAVTRPGADESATRTPA